MRGQEGTWGDVAGVRKGGGRWRVGREEEDKGVGDKREDEEVEEG